MTAVHRLSPPEPFADEAAGFDYFATDLHYQHLASALSRHLARCGFALVSRAAPMDGELLARCLTAEPALRASFAPCRPGEAFDAVMRSFARALRVPENGGEGPLWPVLSQLMDDARKGRTRILVLGNADHLDDRSFDELLRFSRLDEPHLLPVVLLAQPSFAARLDGPGLSFLKPALRAHLSFERLEADEVAAFIRYQLNLGDGSCDDAFTRGAIEAIAFAAKGDPALVNRLARQTTALVRSARAFAHRASSASGSAVAATEPAGDAAAETAAPPAMPPEPAAPVAPAPARPARRLWPAVAVALLLMAAAAAALLYAFGPSL